MSQEFRFTDKQREALKLLSSSCRYTLLRGGGRSSKTFTYIYSIITRALKAPGTNHLIARKHFQHAKQSLWFGTFEAVVKLCYPELVGHIKDNKDLWFKELPNGSRIWFNGLDDAERVDKILGNEYSTIFMNEVSEIRYDTVGTVVSRLAEKGGLVNKMYFDCNPTTTSHWTYQLFMKGKMPDSGKEVGNPEDYQTLQMNPVDNLVNIDANYIKDLENAPEYKRRRFLEGEYVDDLEIAVFLERYFKYYGELQSDKVGVVVQSWDTAFKTKEHNDYSVCTTWKCCVGEKGESEYYLIDIFRKKMDYPTLKQTVLDMAASFRPDTILIEDAASGQSLIQDLRNSTDLPIQALSPQRQDKITRAMYAAEIIFKGKVFFPRLHTLIDEFTAELILFPLAAHDDFVDSLSGFFKWAMYNNFVAVDNEEGMGYIGYCTTGYDSADNVTGY